MTEFETNDIIAYCFGDAPAVLRQEIDQRRKSDRELDAKIQLISLTASEVSDSSLPTEAKTKQTVTPAFLGVRFFGPRSRAKVIAASALVLVLLVPVLVYGTILLLKPKPLVYEDFNDSWFDGNLWRSERPILREENGYLRIMDRGVLVTWQEFNQPIRIKFKWRWIDLSGHPHYAESLSVSLHTKGKHAKKFPFEVLDGITVRFNTTRGLVHIFEPGKILASTIPGTFRMPPNKWHDIEITDDGKEIRAYISGPLIEMDKDKPAVRYRYERAGKSRHIAIFNREVIAGAYHESHIDDLTIYSWEQ